MVDTIAWLVIAAFVGATAVAGLRSLIRGAVREATEAAINRALWRIRTEDMFRDAARHTIADGIRMAAKMDRDDAEIERILSR
jgi:hypothetical protein